MKTPISRRDFLRGSLLLSGAALGGCRARPAAGRTRVLRVAHVTDIHVEARSRARVGIAQVIGHIHAQQDAPGFILNTGDSIMG
jgi:Icc protein